MSEIINLYPTDAASTTASHCNNAELAEITNTILLETRASLENKIAMSMPIADLATLGAGVSSLVPAFRTVTQTTTISTDGLYRLANAGIGDTLKIAKNGNAWGALKTAEGGSKLAQLQEAKGIISTTTAVMPPNPATIMMAFALFSIEQKLGAIEDMQRQIVSFLKIGEEAEIEADIETLTAMLNKYKHNWDNEHYIASNHKLVLDIQRTARKHMISYQKQVADAISTKKILVSQSKVNSTLNDLLRKFKYYRLTLYTFSLASFVELMLSGDFKEENILLVRAEIEKMSDSYRETFSQCSSFLERLSDSSLETNLLKGAGVATKTVGKLIDSIPKIRNGQVDEFLLESGKRMQSSADRIERTTVESFAEISNPGVWVFLEKLNDMIQIYGHTDGICFDEKNVYLIAG